MNTIALNLIVKNEERFLEACLRSVSGLVDEVIVVDTGSTDRTVEIAQSMGATVVHFSWCDDFSAARNAAIEASTSDYLLILDADECLTTDSASVLRRVVDEGRVDAGMLLLHNASEASASPEAIVSGDQRDGEAVRLCRFVRRTPHTRWSGRVHENLGPFLKQPGLVVENLQVDILHYGYLLEVSLERNKFERNTHLLQRRIADDPEDPEPRIYLADEYLRRGKVEEGEALLDDALSKLRRLPVAHRRSPVAVLGISQRLRLDLARGDWQKVRDIFRELDAWDVHHVNFAFYRGRLHEHLAATTPSARARHLKKALQCYRRVLDFDPSREMSVGVDGVYGVRTMYRVAVTFLGLGMPQQALEMLEELRTTDPDCLIAEIRRADVLAAVGRSAEALQLIEPVLTLSPHPDAWVVAARIVEGMGDAKSAVGLLKQAVQRSEGGFLDPDLARDMKSILSRCMASQP